MAHRVPADVRDTFMRHDHNRSGRLDYRELRNTLEALSLDCTTSHAADLLKRYDADGNGLLDLNEFYTMVRELREWQWATCPPDVRAKFLEFDKDRNGRLDYGELRNALQAHAAASCSSTRLRASVLCVPLVIRAIRTSAPPGARPRHEPAARGEPASSVRQGPQRCVAPPSPPQPLVAEEAASLAPPQSTDIVLLPSPQAVRVEAPCVHHAHAAMHTTPSTHTHTPRTHHAHTTHTSRPRASLH